MRTQVLVLETVKNAQGTLLHDLIAFLTVQQGGITHASPCQTLTHSPDCHTGGGLAVARTGCKHPLPILLIVSLKGNAATAIRDVRVKQRCISRTLIAIPFSAPLRF